MVDCEFLYHEVKKTCTNCRGWFCLSRGSRKKLLDTAMCIDEEAWIECPRYLEAHPEPEPEAEVEEKRYASSLTKLPRSCPECGHEEGYLVFTEPDYGDMWACEKCDHEFPGYKFVEMIEVAVEPLTVQLIPPAPSNDCPYLGPIPEGEHGCCDYWCYAKDERLRSVKSCKSRPSWRECMRRLKAEKAGVKYALG